MTNTLFPSKRSAELCEVSRDLLKNFLCDHALRPRLKVNQAHGLELAVSGVLVDARQVRRHNSLRRWVRHQRFNRCVDRVGSSRFALRGSQRGSGNAGNKQQRGERSEFHSGRVLLKNRPQRIGAAICLHDEAGSAAG